MWPSIDDLVRTCKLDLKLKFGGLDLQAAADGIAPVLVVFLVVMALILVWARRPGA